MGGTQQLVEYVHETLEYLQVLGEEIMTSVP
jgi:hypothetical protein